MNHQELVSLNPWWDDPKLILRDKNLVRRAESNFNWIPRLLFFFKIDEDAIYTVRGPRQVGKTTFVKLMIQKILDSKVQSNQVFFWACDLVENPKELVAVINSYLNYAREKHDERLYIFLDEISSVKDWQKGIKFLVDSGSLKNCTLILTGSHSLDIKTSAERLPGRRGNVEDVLDKVFLPMKFSEFVDVRSDNLRKAIRFLNLLKRVRRDEIILQLAKAKIPKELEKLNTYSKELSKLFQEYLITGGIPSAIDAYIANGEIPANVYEIYVSSMLGDLARWKQNQRRMTQIVQRLVECLSIQVNWNSLCKQTDMTPQTMQEYVDALQSAFVVSTVYRLDRNKAAPSFEKDKKVYFEDPFIFHALRGWAFSIPQYLSALEFLGNPEACSKLVESVVCDHIIRLTFNMFPSSSYEYTNRVFYWEDSSKKEVDFVVKLDGTYIPIEVKFRSDVKTDDLNGLHNFMEGGSCNGGIVITKNQLKTEQGIAYVPYYLFLALI